MNQSTPLQPEINEVRVSSINGWRTDWKTPYLDAEREPHCVITNLDADQCVARQARAVGRIEAYGDPLPHIRSIPVQIAQGAIEEPILTGSRHFLLRTGARARHGQQSAGNQVECPNSPIRADLDD